MNTFWTVPVRPGAKVSAVLETISNKLDKPSEGFSLHEVGTGKGRCDTY